MKSYNFPNEKGYGIPLLILSILIISYLNIIYKFSVEKEVDFFLNYSVQIILSSFVLIFSIFFSFKFIKKSFREKDKFSMGFIFVSLFIVLIVFLPTNNKINKVESKDECKNPDDSGNFMDLVINKLKGKGYGISGYYFSGNGFYNITVIRPTGKIGSSEVEVLVNECGEILRIIE